MTKRCTLSPSGSWGKIQSFSRSPTCPRTFLPLWLNTSETTVVIKSESWRILKTTLISRRLMNFTSKIKVDFNLYFKEQFWRILKTTLISRQLMNFTLISKNSSDTFSKQPWFQGNFDFLQVHIRGFWRISCLTKNNFDFKATHEFYRLGVEKSSDHS